MKRLYIGCRVRLVSKGANATSRNPVGVEGRIIEAWPDYAEAEWLVSWVGAPDPETCANSDRLEPIQDPGHQIVSWEAMKDLWTPEGIPA